MVCARVCAAALLSRVWSSPLYVCRVLWFELKCESFLYRISGRREMRQHTAGRSLCLITVKLVRLDGCWIHDNTVLRCDYGGCPAAPVSCVFTQALEIR